MAGRRKPGWLVALLGSALAGGLVLCPAGSSAATSSSAFLPLSGTARTFGLGGAGIALVDDASAAFVNPSRLVFQQGSSATAGYARMVEGLSSGRIELAYSRALGPDISVPGQNQDVHPFAFGVTVQHQGLELSQGSAYWEGALGAAAGLALQNFAAVGVGLRALRADSDVDGVSASGAAVDLGFSVALYPWLEAAAVGRNIAGSVKFEGAGSEALVRSYTLGLAWRRAGEIAGELDFQAESGGVYSVAFGVEGVLAGTLVLRGGLREWIKPESRLVPTGGLGLRSRRIGIDYGIQIDESEALGLAHRVTLAARF